MVLSQFDALTAPLFTQGSRSDLLNEHARFHTSSRREIAAAEKVDVKRSSVARRARFSALFCNAIEQPTATDNTKEMSMSSRRNRFRVVGAAGFLSCVLLALVGFCVVAFRHELVAHASDSDDPDFFEAHEIPRLHFSIEEAALGTLEAEHRPYVRAQLTEESKSGEAKYRSVGVKLKGAAGSYQGVDAKPGMTINMDKFQKKQTFHGLDKFHLNNAVQDDTWMHEWLCAEVFREAGYPTARVSHATVELNDRALGLYVVRESYDGKAMKRLFANPNGNLYDGGFLQDIHVDLKKDWGAGPDDHSDLKELTEACNAPDPKQRYELIEKRLNVDRFITFMALERMTCHWDGYCQSANNYRVYFEPETERAIFLPHGADQTFGETGMGLFDHSSAMVATQILGNDQWRAMYRERVRELMPLFVPADPLIEKVRVAAERLEPVIERLGGEEEVIAFRERVEGLKNRLRERAANLIEQIEQPDPEPLEIAEGKSAALVDWYPSLDREEMVATGNEEGAKGDGLQLTIPTGVDGQASWRTSVLLRRGTYRFHGRYQLTEAVPIDEEQRETLFFGSTDGMRWARPKPSSAWRSFSHQITIVEDRRGVEFFIGMRAREGHMLIDTKSLRLSKIQENGHN